MSDIEQEYNCEVMGAILWPGWNRQDFPWVMCNGRMGLLEAVPLKLAAHLQAAKSRLLGLGVRVQMKDQVLGPLLLWVGHPSMGSPVPYHPHTVPAFDFPCYVSRRPPRILSKAGLWAQATGHFLFQWFMMHL